MSIINNTLLLAAEEGGYRIERSLRFRSAASAYLNRTPGTAGSRTTWTWSGWVKKSDAAIADNTDRILFSAGTLGTIGAQFGYISFSTYSGTAGINNSLRFANGIWGITGDYDAATTSNYRDPSAWYHVVVAFDSTNGTAANRVKLYINGVLLTNVVGYAGRPTTASLNYATAINNNVAHYVGGFPGASGYNPWDGYMTEINFVDGQALTPSSFGEYNATTGVWQPIKYAGTYGTNGFYLNFSDNASTTTLGDDLSGNGNDWTTNNFSLTAGATYDSMIDTPTPYADGGNGRGNYAVLNPLAAGTASYLNSGNLNASISASNTTVFGTFQLPTSGKWYWEHQITTIAGGGSPMGGIATTASNSPAVFYRSNGEKIVDGAGSSYGATYTTSDTIGVAVDVDGGTVVFYKNNISQGSITYAAAGFFPALRSSEATDVFNINFGQRPFAYTPPTGFKALNTQNLPEPTVVDGKEYFDVSLYTGTSATQTIVNSGGMSPDLVWTKSRNNASNQSWIDSVRGGSKALFSDSTDSEYTATYISSFNSDGFTIGSTGSSSLNASGYTYVAWQWRASDSAAVSNTAGSITSTVSANPTAGFSVVTYTGTGANATVGHGLGVAPRMILIKSRSQSANWTVYHASVGNTGALFLNLTNATDTGSAYWNNTSPTSSVFTINTGSASNTSGQTYVAYCFAPVAGYSAFGSYTGNGSADGPFVFTGFRPRYVMIKGSSFVSNWFVIDTSRSAYNVSLDALRPNLSGVETSTGTYSIDILSNGFKLRTDAADSNTNAATFIWAAFAESPFRNSLAR